MAFSGSSYFAGIGTAFAAIAVGFAGGAMITTSAVQPPNRLERVNAGADATPSPIASSNAEQENAAKPASQEAPPSPAAAKTDAAANVQERTAPAAAAKNSTPAPVAKSDDAAPAKSERITVGRAPDPSRDVSRKRADDRKPSDDRKFSDRRRRQDQDDRRLDEATNVVRQMPRGNVVDEIVEREDAPRFRMRPRHFELYGDDDVPRVVSEPPPRFGLFGNN